MCCWAEYARFRDKLDSLMRSDFADPSALRNELAMQRAEDRHSEAQRLHVAPAPVAPELPAVPVILPN